jgi:hypothetical protein
MLPLLSSVPKMIDKYVIEKRAPAVLRSLLPASRSLFPVPIVPSIPQLGFSSSFWT